MFKTKSIEDYQRYRSVMQVIDLSVFDLIHYRFDYRQIVASCIYIQLGLSFLIFERKHISNPKNILGEIVKAEQDTKNLEFFEMMNDFI